MPRLFTAEVIAFLQHFFKHITVAYIGFYAAPAMFCHCFVQAYITHNGCYKHIIVQLFLFHQFQRTDKHNLIAVKRSACFINGKAAVGVAIVGNAHVCSFFQHFGLQSLKMRTAAAIINVNAVRLVKNGNNMRAQGTQNYRCNQAVGAVGAVHNNL